jgi:hypothetical protein
MKVSGQHHTPAALLPGENPWFLCKRRLLELRKWSGSFGEKKILLPLPGFSHPARALITIPTNLPRLLHHWIAVNGFRLHSACDLVPVRSMYDNLACCILMQSCSVSKLIKI